jgi:hypothetical protein
MPAPKLTLIPPPTTAPATTVLRREVLAIARVAIAEGHERFSLRNAIEAVRDTFRVQINGNDQKELGMWLRTQLPEIGSIMRTRNTGRGPNKLRPELAALDRILSKGATITSVTVEADGKRYQVSIDTVMKAAKGAA